MQFWRCECGKCEKYESGMPPQPCEGCDECGTAFAQRPGDHVQKIGHDWKPQFDGDAGKPARPICKRCYARGPKPEGA